MVRAQTDRKRATEPYDLLGDIERVSTLPSQSAVQGRGAALESTIDPLHYYVGPSDVFAVTVWNVPQASFVLTVTPEGSLYIPTVGEVRVSDMTLDAAKARVLAELKRKYTAGQASVTLTAARPILVTVLGTVLNPATYTLAAHNRIDRAIEEANKPVRNQEADAAEPVMRAMSQRHILVKHKDGTTSRADIPRFRATRDNRLNPYLREGDVVVVPRLDRSSPMTAIYGDVNAPDHFEFVQGDSVKDLVGMAFGFTATAIADSIELFRQSTDAERQDRRLLDGRAILAGEQADLALLPGDRIVVRRKRDLRTDRRVSVQGEVHFPGFYPIARQSTKLSEIIAAAGGFTDLAALGSSEVIRRSVDPSALQLERLESLRGGVAQEDSAYFVLETELRLRKEIVNVDFEKLFLNKDSTQDLVLRDGDYINIPALTKSVYVFGQVVSPGNIAFLPGADYRYYIQKAGGATDRAREGDVRIVKARTKQWLSPGDTEMEAGDYVWVPKDPERPFAYYLSTMSQAAAIISVAISAIVLAVQLGK
jgi:protein involved in polysaccharide export with SLBB domain